MMSCFNHFFSFLHCSIALVVIIAIALAAVLCSCVALAYYCHIRRKVRSRVAAGKQQLPRQQQQQQQPKKSASSGPAAHGPGGGGGGGGDAHYYYPGVARATPVRFAPDPAAQVFTYKQLQQATDNFSPVRVVGHGGFGCVYRGVLPDGRVAAIKQLDWGGKQGDHEFRVEVDMLSRLRSHYLLDLIGYCADQEHRLLVYQFMPRGSLQEHLYPDASAYVRPSQQVLDWRKRMRIALHAARGLEYLHELVRPPIIHRDLKSSNILLDDGFNAKVSDFGLAKHGSEKVGGHVSTRVLGTTGYVAPEYALTGHLTTKSDVYSYGVVLLELLTGRVPVDMKRPPGQGVLVSWALPRLTDREKLIEMVDPALGGQFPVKELVQVAAIAAMCVQPEADYRPLMTDVVQSLVPLVRTHHH